METDWPQVSQALLALAHLGNGDTYTCLAAGSEIGIATAWRYVQEAITLLSAAADDLNAAMRRIRLLAYAILDGALIPIDRVADQKPHYSGEHKRHGVNVQVVADAAGRPVWASAALPGAVHDLTAAHAHGIIDALNSANVMTFADKGYQGACGTVRTPFKRHCRRPKLSRRQKAVNRAHAKLLLPDALVTGAAPANARSARASANLPRSSPISASSRAPSWTPSPGTLVTIFASGCAVNISSMRCSSRSNVRQSASSCPTRPSSCSPIASSTAADWRICLLLKCA
ncbi:hypothetical protein JCM9533A_77740 [Catenuloplanes niger JCM 9533]|uniref:DDE Tnp4 domain-containing protein n=1 Tax=Catenuloplanes niger TaxID=587534 RepID=A0AAE3ZLB9_9ACTN|nr:hypothetical protein [Catenuloplanes niger]